MIFDSLEMGEIVIIGLFVLLCCGICMGAGFELGKQWDKPTIATPTTIQVKDCPDTRLDCAICLPNCFNVYNDSRAFAMRVYGTEKGYIK
jgi:hypothetical protein